MSKRCTLISLTPKPKLWLRSLPGLAPQARTPLSARVRSLSAFSTSSGPSRPDQQRRQIREYMGNLARLRFTRRARQLGFTLDEIRGLLRLAVTDDEHARSEARNLTSAHIADIRTKIAVLQAMGF